jgi:2,3-bisphosphoglycerate-independent phosphoglycerate mutase
MFLDGVGLGEDNPELNPFIRALTPNFDDLLGRRKIIADGHLQGVGQTPYLVNTNYASLLALDACLGIEGLPQSATGQASLITGMNISAQLGFHEGPKPTPPIINIIKNGTLISQLEKQGRSAALVNAFPRRYFDTIEAGYRLPGVIALSTRQAGFPLKTTSDLFEGNAISADFTGEGWRSHLGIEDTPVLSVKQAGERLNTLTRQADLSIFEYWLTDLAGHHRDMPSASKLLETLDEVVGSLVDAWDFDNGLILITSDHGNLEDLTTRHHTRNDVPLILIGSPMLRKSFVEKLGKDELLQSRLDLTDLAPAMLNFIG